MHTLKDFAIDKGCKKTILLADVPALVLPQVTTIHDEKLSDRIIIEIDEKLKPLRLIFSCAVVKGTFTIYYDRNEDLSDASFLSAIAFTVRIPKGYTVEFV